ncbi:MAG TPA: hypothetical protein VES92_08150, partial [Nitrospiraceae bacterium]|nr:hypothetical protein [Nitrospiraceae bacterium]
MDANLIKFKGRLPYASEIFGVFQPLLGWKSRLIQNRLAAALALPEFPKVLHSDSPRNSDHILLQFAPGSELELVDGQTRTPERLLELFEENSQLVQFQVLSYLDSLLVRSIQSQMRNQLTAHPPEDAEFWSDIWSENLSQNSLNKRMTEIAAQISGKPVFRKLVDEAATDPLLEYIQRIRLGFANVEDAVTYVFNKEVY